MIKNWKNLIKAGLLLCSVMPFSSWASCTMTGVTSTADGNTASMPFGKINLTDQYFVPVGSLLASIVIPPSNYTAGGVTAGNVSWECDEADLPNIYFLVATNGDDRVGGFYDLGAKDGIPNAYATWFAYVALKQTMAGVTLSRIWQKIPVTNYMHEGGKIKIRLQDIPPMVAELYRVSSLPGTDAASSYCWNNNTDGLGIGKARPSGQLYNCTQPNSYIQLSGNANVYLNFAHDEVGSDSKDNFAFWGIGNGFGYGMRGQNKLYSNATCVARSADPMVNLPLISQMDLNAGKVSTALFNVRIECSDAVNSGVNDRQTALGFQVSPGAYSAAQKLGLVNSAGGVTALVSDNYDAPDMAKGVGITLAYSNMPAQPLLFVGQQSAGLLIAPGSNAGWYPVLNYALPAGSSVPGYSYYDYSFIATLKKLSGQQVQPGKVHATAYVLVKMQ